MIKGISKGERIWVTKTTKCGGVYYITSKEFDRNMYYLYQLDGDRAVKIGKSKSPKKLDEMCHDD